MSFTDFSPLSSRTLGDPKHPTVRAPAAILGSRAPKPPRGFKLLQGIPTHVRYGGTVPPTSKRATFAQRAGINYERKIHDILSAIYGARYRISPSILFQDRSGLRRAIPDGILEIERTLVIIEVKLTHTEKAWWQLEGLYKPLVTALSGSGTSIRTCEITRSYDPVVQFPAPHILVESLHRLPESCVGVLQWKI